MYTKIFLYFLCFAVGVYNSYRVINTTNVGFYLTTFGLIFATNVFYQLGKRLPANELP